MLLAVIILLLYRREDTPAPLYLEIYLSYGDGPYRDLYLQELRVHDVALDRAAAAAAQAHDLFSQKVHGPPLHEAHVEYYSHQLLEVQEQVDVHSLKLAARNLDPYAIDVQAEAVLAVHRAYLTKLPCLLIYLEVLRDESSIAPAQEAKGVDLGAGARGAAERCRTLAMQPHLAPTLRTN